MAWIIEHETERDEESGNLLKWSNNDGWIDGNDFDTFTDDTKAAKVGEDIAEPWYRVAANKLAERAGEGYRAAHSKASFGDSSYVNGPEFSVRFSDHSANPENRPNQMMITSQTDRQTGRFIPPSYDEDTSWRFLTNNPSPEEMLNQENKLKLLQGAYDEKRALAQQAYDAELSKGGKNAHKRAIGAARQIQSGFSL